MCAAPSLPSNEAARDPRLPRPPVIINAPLVRNGTRHSCGVRDCLRSLGTRSVELHVASCSATEFILGLSNNARASPSAFAPLFTPMLVGWSLGCSRRSTRMRPHTPPCAAADAASAGAASALQVMTSSEPGGLVGPCPSCCCAAASVNMAPQVAGATESALVKIKATSRFVEKMRGTSAMAWPSCASTRALDALPAAVLGAHLANDTQHVT
mmetsp:Transcript_4764/g.10103  ORF Transcript_4764/g.10103 Transcript_4764/m.10103 type:complete len:212 (-) Transcript_4764:2607-3242(-)